MILMRCFLISSLLLLNVTVAFADRKISDAARKELVRGEDKFRQQDFAAAIEAFDAGYAIDPQPIFLYDKAQAQRLSGDCKSAIETYRAFLATVPPAREASRARQNIAKCEALLPPPPPPRVEPPPPVVVDSEPSPIEQLDVPIGPGTPPAQAIHRERDAWWSDGVGITLVTTGMVGLGLGTGFAITARSAAADTKDAPNLDGWSASNRRWERDRLIAAVSIGSGAALFVTGLLRLSLRDRSVSLTPASGDGAVLSLGGSW
jgi:hypothetical protein